MKRTLLGFLVLLCLCLSCSRRQPASLLAQETGGAIPDFTAAVARGGSFHISEQRGRTVLVAFLQTQPDSGAGNPSRALVPLLLSMDHQYRNSGVDVIIVDATALAMEKDASQHRTAASNAPGMDRLLNTSYNWNLPVPLLADPAGSVARICGVSSAPTVLLVDPGGHIVQRWIGAQHPASVAAGIQQLVGGPMKDRPPLQ